MTDAHPTAGRDAAASTTGATVAAGGLWQLATRLLPQVYTVLVSVAAARALGPEGMGRQSFIAFVAMSATLVFTSALPLALTRYTGELTGARREADVRALIRWAWTIQGTGAALSAGGLVAAAVLGSTPQAAWVLAGLGAGVAVMQSVPASALAGLQQWRGISIAGLATGALSVLAQVTVLVLGGGIIGMFAVELAVAVVNLGAAWILAARSLAGMPDAGRLDSTLRNDVLRYTGASLLGAVLTFVVWRRSEFFFLAAYSTDTQIAIYSISYAAAAAVAMVPSAVSLVLSPAFATLHGAGARDRLRSGYARAIRLTLTLALPLAACSAVLGTELVLLVYGREYEGARPVLVVLLAVVPAIAVHSVAQAMLTGLAKVRVPLIIGMVAATANVLLDVVLIPRYDAVGAAIANSCAQLVAIVPILLYANRLMAPVAWHAGRLVLAAVAATAAGGAAAVPVLAAGGVAGVAAGTVAAGVVLVLAGPGLRILEREDAEWLALTARAHVPPVVRRWLLALGAPA